MRNSCIFTTISFLIFLYSCTSVEKKELKPATIFSDNMVLQQKTEAVIWGKANPNETINIAGSWDKKVTVNADATGNWSAKLETIEAGGPYEVTIANANTTIKYTNVLLGEVWICSGQSNMEMPLKGWPPNDTINNSENEIKTANYPNIRLLQVDRVISNKPLDSFTGTWQECNPQNIENFSATAYFFGKNLHKEINVPIGLIHTSWGGTPAEAWTSSDFLEQMADYSTVVDDVSNIETKMKKIKEHFETFDSVDISAKNDTWKNLKLNDDDCTKPDFDDTKWKDSELPGMWETNDYPNFDGIVWYRKQIEIPEKWTSQDLYLHLAKIDDMDVVWFNGTRIGGVEENGFWSLNRIYKVPATLVKIGKNIISIRVIDNSGAGGIYGNKDSLYIATAKNENDKISLVGTWKSLQIAEFFDNKLYNFGITGDKIATKPVSTNQLNSHTPTVLYNAMIAPLIPYAIKGAIWYQGETNVNRAKQYQELFPLMIKCWREKWKQGDFPFYFAQISPFMYSDYDHIESALLREAQTMTLSLTNTGMAVTMDIGNIDNIHPSNKQDVGKRLALWALAKDYGKTDIAYSGPIYKSMEISDNKIILTFDYAESGLMAKDGDLINFAIAGEDKQFVEANAIIENDKVIVTSSKVKNPVAVRYAFTNGATPNLFNKEGLPAPSFRTDTW